MGTPDKAIPNSVLAKAEGIAVFPPTVKGGFIFGAHRGQTRGQILVTSVLEGDGALWRLCPGDPRLRRPAVGSVINRRLSTTSPRWSGSREFTPILAALRRFIASHAITDRRDDHVNVARPHPEPAMRSPCSLGRVPTSVTTSSGSCARPPAIIEDLHTIADLRDPDQIRRDSDAGATRWPRGRVGGAGVGRFHASREREVP